MTSSHRPLPAVADVSRDAEEFLHDVGDLVRETVHDIKPRLRGWLHATTAPLALASLLGALLLTEETRARTGTAIFLTTAVLMFTTSALYHTRPWSTGALHLWKRVDHANIFVLIAGSCTPFALMILDSRDAMRLLTLVWGGALAGVLFKVCWIGAPRWLSVGLYMLLGSATLLFVPEFMASGPRGVLLLFALGGGLYLAGALVYGFKRPNPIPTLFGFHEVFHALTVTAFAAHCCGVGLLVLG